MENNFFEENARDAHKIYTSFKVVSVIYGILFLAFIALVVSIALS